MFSEKWLQNIQHFSMQTETLMNEMTQFKAEWEHTLLKYTEHTLLKYTEYTLLKYMHIILCWEILNV
jgi:hypothetical protein